jgi:hypothetical protein
MEVLEFEATSFTWEENTKLRSLTLAGSEQVTLTLEADSPNGLHFEINGNGAHQAVESFRLSAAALECFLHPSPTLPLQIRIKLTTLPIAKITELASHLQLLTVD